MFAVCSFPLNLVKAEGSSGWMAWVLKHGPAKSVPCISAARRKCCDLSGHHWNSHGVLPVLTPLLLFQALRSFKLTVTVDPKYHPKIIGRKGAVITQIRTEHEVNIQFPDKDDESQVRDQGEYKDG